MVAAETPLAALKVFFRTYAPADKDWSFQLWLDAWAEAARRPAVRAISRRLNLEWQGLLEGVIRAGVADGTFTLRRTGRRGMADPVPARRTRTPGHRPRNDDRPGRRHRLDDRRRRA
ncbi:MAG: TetR family transcriptional regulator C-terminal domain-containing protein [Candidatus Limnocylindrales bacterium]